MVFATPAFKVKAVVLFVSIPNRGLWFLRPDWAVLQVAPASEFQSLIGVYGFCGFVGDFIAGLLKVSIPNRGLWFLRRSPRMKMRAIFPCFNP